jgi:hypothetical protein
LNSAAHKAKNDDAFAAVLTALSFANNSNALPKPFIKEMGFEEEN